MVDPAQKDANYHWLMPDGTRLSGTEQELRAALASGVLSAGSLVWRKGWVEWQAVSRVAELASALPPAKAAEHKSSPTAVQMPPLVPRTPLTTSRPSATTVRTGGLSSPAPRPSRNPSPGAHEAARDTLAPALAPSSFGNLGGARRPSAPARRESGPPPPPVRGRAPLPTLSEESGAVSATATLRPPGAVPPPPRGVPAPSLDSSPYSSEKRVATMTPVPAFGPPGGRLLDAALPRVGFDPAPSATLPEGASALTPSITQPSAAPVALPQVVNKTLLSASTEAGPESIEPSLDSTLEVVAKVPPEARRTPVDPLTPARSTSSAPAEGEHAAAAQRDSVLKIGRIGLDSRTVLMALSGLSGALLVAVIGLAWSHSGSKTPEPGSNASVSAAPLPAPAPAIIAGCRLGLPPARIFANVERAVPPYVAQLPNKAELALGFAETKTKGVGLRLDPATLDVTPSFEEEGKDAVRGVVPLTHSGSLAFFVDRDDKALHSAHTVDEVPPFTLGVNEAGFSRVVAGSTSLVWPLDASVKITEPRSAQVADYGYGVAFRRGGQAGSVLLGFVAADGEKKTELAEIPNAPKLLGTPVIAGSAAGALVAFAGRDAQDAPWQLFVSLTKPGAAPSPARALITGSGGGAISPTLSALGAERWLVQWTEGASGQYHVHVQSFSADLSPIGAPVLVSPKGANAGQGSLSAFAGQAASLFILTTAGHDELWGATLSCP